MRNRLTMSWGVIPGRQVGNVTKRFHKKRKVTVAERAAAKALGVNAREARRRLRYQRELLAKESPEARALRQEQDLLRYHAEKREAARKDRLRAEREEAARQQRVADYLATMGNK